LDVSQPFIAKSVATLEADMTAPAIASWETVRYAKIGHAFSKWFDVENYNERVDTRSWESFASFAAEAFGMGATSATFFETNVLAANNYSDALDGDYPLVGYVALPSPVSNSTPVVIVLPSNMDENGPGSFEQQVATQIAANNNYIVFVADIFSYDRKDTAANKLEELYYSNTTKFMSRVKAAIEYAKTIWHADPNKIALTGFGFGGSGALMYGMGVGGGIDSSVKAIASFYGNMAKVVNATDDMVDI
jgi:hypothetical protein